MYISTTAVVVAEVLKVLACLVILLIQRKSFGRLLSLIHEQIIDNYWDTLKLSIPSLLYTLQNNLQYVAISNLDAAIFQVSFAAHPSRERMCLDHNNDVVLSSWRVVVLIQ